MNQASLQLAQTVFTISAEWNSLLQVNSILRTVGAYAHDVNHLMAFLLATSVIFTTLICLCLLFFVFKYRRSPENQIAKNVESQTWLEVTWTAIPLLITITIFVWGARQYLVFDQTPAEAQEISVLARQWMWKFHSLNGLEEINDLHLPIGGTYKLTMISQDVIHSFFLPDLRVKYDVLPDRYTQLWFKPEVAGVFPILCTQFCGTDHSKMIGRLIVMTKNDYETWRLSQTARIELAPEISGRELFTQKACASCHADHKIGPELSGVAGSEVKVMINGQVHRRLADDDYLRESILDPAHAITQGFQNVMPSYKGQLSEGEILKLIEYMKNMIRNAPLNSAPNSRKRGEAT